MSEPTIELPLKIREFNTIAGLVFEQLYRAFPEVIDLDRRAIGKAMGVPESDWAQYQLPSGLSLAHMWAHTVGWLSSEGFIRSAGGHPAERVWLTHKGLMALNAVPSGLQQTIGTAIVEGGRTGDLTRIGSLIGGMFGGAIKTLAGG
jgi:hypothetical protein